MLMVHLLPFIASISLLICMKYANCAFDCIPNSGMVFISNGIGDDTGIERGRDGLLGDAVLLRTPVPSRCPPGIMKHSSATTPWLHHSHQCLLTQCTLECCLITNSVHHFCRHRIHCIRCCSGISHSTRCCHSMVWYRIRMSRRLLLFAELRSPVLEPDLQCVVSYHSSFAYSHPHLSQLFPPLLRNTLCPSDLSIFIHPNI